MMAARVDCVSLELTNGGRIVDDWPDLGTDFPGWATDPPPNAYQLWGGISKKYARGATGAVTVFQDADRAAAGGGYVWKNAEEPIVRAGLKSGKITRVTTHVIPVPPAP